MRRRQRWRQSINLNEITLAGGANNCDDNDPRAHYQKVAPSLKVSVTIESVGLVITTINLLVGKVVVVGRIHSIGDCVCVCVCASAVEDSFCAAE